MFKKKKYDVDKEKAFEIIRNAKKLIVIMNDDEGMIDGDTDYIRGAFLQLTKNLMKDGIISLPEIVDYVKDESSKMITIKAKTKDEAIKKLEQEMNKIEKKRNKKAEGK
jgi:hypothetical protein